MIVDPTNDIPRFLRSLEIVCEISDSVTKSLIVWGWLMIGLWFTKFQKYVSKLPNSCWIRRVAIAFFLTEYILSLFLIIPGSRSIFSSTSSVIFEIFSIFQSWKWCRYCSLLRSTVTHESPAWAHSRVRNSKRTRSSCTGTPHSLSW